MDLRIIMATFGAVFLMELGDKTQVATFLLAAKHGSPWPVFVGSASALVVAALIAATCGHFLHRYISPIWMNRITGVVFVGIGIVMLLSTMINRNPGR